MTKHEVTGAGRFQEKAETGKFRRKTRRKGTKGCAGAFARACVGCAGDAAAEPRSTIGAGVDDREGVLTSVAIWLEAQDRAPCLQLLYTLLVATQKQ